MLPGARGAEEALVGCPPGAATKGCCPTWPLGAAQAAVSAGEAALCCMFANWPEPETRSKVTVLQLPAGPVGDGSDEELPNSNRPCLDFCCSDAGSVLCCLCGS